MAFLGRMREKKYCTKYRYVMNSSKYYKKCQTWLKLFLCTYFLYNEFKGASHKGNCTKYKLSNDIEKNPGPSVYYVDPSKTIKAPYSQGNNIIFGENAGQQCIAMSLCALIYHKMKGINTTSDLEQIMHIGNELYSSLSQLARQSFLMLTELPTMLTVLEENYQSDYSLSYTGNVHNDKHTMFTYIVNIEEYPSWEVDIAV